MEKEITEKKLKQYLDLTEKALKIAEKNINSEKKQEAKEILAMVEAYLSDSKHFKKQGNLVNSFAAVNYAHGWLDSGARLGVFKVKDTSLFTIE